MKNETLKPGPRPAVKIALISVAVAILVMVYIFQRVDLVGALSGPTGILNPYVTFIVNRVIRLIVNDLACLLVIYVLFRGKRYLSLAWRVFLLELFILLPAYLAIKLSMEGPSEISSPLLSHVHRLIVNPTLMLLLMAGFLYQNHTHRHQA
jgi:exosortase F-associated protein